MTENSSGWFHYTSQPEFALDRSRVYDEPHPAKPDGFWIAPVEDGWRAWREAESWGIPDVDYAYRVTLNPAANLLTLGSIDIPELHERFPLHDGSVWERDYPDWRAIMGAYDGVLIPRYHWEHRFDVNWYYGWDCASGCIWNLDAIAAVTLAHSLPREEAVSFSSSEHGAG